jgi:uncharacterized protein YjbJ (UPF0337 family)
MNSDELKGKIENLKGRARQALGTLTGSKKQEAEGVADRVEGAAREKIGEAKETAERKRHQYEDAEETDDE